MGNCTAGHTPVPAECCKSAMITWLVPCVKGASMPSIRSMGPCVGTPLVAATHAANIMALVFRKWPLRCVPGSQIPLSAARQSTVRFGHFHCQLRLGPCGTPLSSAMFSLSLSPSWADIVTGMRSRGGATSQSSEKRSASAIVAPDKACNCEASINNVKRMPNQKKKTALTAPPQ